MNIGEPIITYAAGECLVIENGSVSFDTPIQCHNVNVYDCGTSLCITDVGTFFICISMSITDRSVRSPTGDTEGEVALSDHPVSMHVHVNGSEVLVSRTDNGYVHAFVLVVADVGTLISINVISESLTFGEVASATDITCSGTYILYDVSQHIV